MGRNKKGDPVNGWINFDKPYGMTSTQAVGKIRRLLNAQKIGHAGTLDPLATGVLPIALGEATKTIPFAQDADKTYSFTIAWGEQRDTDDMEGQIIATSDYRPTQTEIEAALPQFTGEIEQIPPLYSAIKINGERAYDLARAGEIPDLKARKVFIKSLKIISHPGAGRDPVNESDAQYIQPDQTPPSGGVTIEMTSFLMSCGKGTYVRSLARDMGEILGTKGYIRHLRREKVGCFDAKDAISLDNLEAMDYQSARNKALLPLQTVLGDIPALALKMDETARLRSGQTLNFISRSDFERLEKVGLGRMETITALALFNGAPVALVEQTRAEIKPFRVFNCP